MNILFLTGLSASGKSTIAQQLGEQINIPVINLREVLRTVARKNGFERTRYWIVSVGLPTMLEEGRKELINLIQQHDNDVIVDDLIDPETPKMMHEYIRGSNIVVARVKTNRHLRKHWITWRMEAPNKEALKELHFLDSIKRRSGITLAIINADIEVRNFGRIDEAVRELQSKLEMHQLRHHHGIEQE